MLSLISSNILIKLTIKLRLALYIKNEPKTQIQIIINIYYIINVKINDRK